ncbi:hypothetical protein [Rathayibacter toxicus]|uniref:hypothetical protein n=1 Tax=Rathayibacter toxicus TaxID=145458 RepID=UPI0011B09C4F|nr:hypothetical protein [Rathayibacter toxicus]QWL34924.1 hypothetical protein E2R36_08380 [Rathayibacter toxicus]QWL39147.1 hypothetical protein E2R38_08370 [Rathayibacter toxicus]QWL43339.1 hypothetical protein E2R40_08370 [Rathayibacter toxicus]QWL47517.1 hypothetical protein E2R42_08370 [Rathayibacter toxicus]
MTPVLPHTVTRPPRGHRGGRRRRDGALCDRGAAPHDVVLSYPCVGRMDRGGKHTRRHRVSTLHARAGPGTVARVLLGHPDTPSLDEQGRSLRKRAGDQINPSSAKRHLIGDIRHPQFTNSDRWGAGISADRLSAAAFGGQPRMRTIL